MRVIVSITGFVLTFILSVCLTFIIYLGGSSSDEQIINKGIELTYKQEEQINQARIIPFDPRISTPVYRDSPYGFVRNASPFSSRLVIKSLNFKRPITIILTKEQRQLFYENTNRYISELQIQPTQNAYDLSDEYSPSFFTKVGESITSIFKPDRYHFHFMLGHRESGFDLDQKRRSVMYVGLHERKVHKWLKWLRWS